MGPVFVFLFIYLFIYRRVFVRSVPAAVSSNFGFRLAPDRAAFYQIFQLRLADVEVFPWFCSSFVRL